MPPATDHRSRPPVEPSPSDPASGAARARFATRVDLLVGAVLGAVILGPALGPGSLLSLDLLVTPHIPIPNGLYGLGPALSQRVPSFAALGLASFLLGGPLATKLALLAMVASAYAGAARLVGPGAHPLTRAASGVLWAGGPFLLTRIGVGHLNVVWALAVLPWMVPRLARPSADPRATFLASCLLAFGGPASGTLGVAVVAVSLVCERRRARPIPVAAGVAVANLLWVLPTAVLLWAGAEVTGSGGFATRPVGVAGWLSLPVGTGFWRADFQAGATGWAAAIAGVVVFGLACVGRPQLDHRWRAPLTAVAAVGLALSLASTVPVVRDAYRWVSGLSIGAPLRESHRFLALWLLGAAPAAALGGAELARRLAAGHDGRRRLAPVALVLPLAAGVLAGVPGWWGIDGRLDPVDFPAGWAAAHERIEAQPGTTVALPWSEYPPLSFADGRQAFNPIPDYLGGDVISSYDPLFHPGQISQEQVDRRAVVVDRLARAAWTGGWIGKDLAHLGVRWVFLAHEGGWNRYGSLASDPGLRRVIHRSDVDLYEVRAWVGPVVGPDGTPHRLGRPVPPLLTTPAPRGSVVGVAGAPGWIQGWATPVAVTVDGRLRLAGSGGVLWFWPAPVLTLADLSIVVAAVWCWRSRRSAADPEPRPEGAIPDHPS